MKPVDKGTGGGQYRKLNISSRQLLNSWHPGKLTHALQMCWSPAHRPGLPRPQSKIQAATQGSGEQGSFCLWCCLQRSEHGGRGCVLRNVSWWRKRPPTSSWWRLSAEPASWAGWCWLSSPHHVQSSSGSRPLGPEGATEGNQTGI